MYINNSETNKGDNRSAVGAYRTEHKVLKGLYGTFNGTYGTNYIEPVRIRTYLDRDSDVAFKVTSTKSNAGLTANAINGSQNTWNNWRLKKGKNELQIRYANNQVAAGKRSEFRIESSHDKVGFAVVHGLWLPGGGPDINDSNNTTFVYTAPPTNSVVNFTLTARWSAKWWIKGQIPILYLTDLNGRIIAHNRGGYRKAFIRANVEANQKYLVVAANSQKGGIDEFSLEVDEGLLH